MGALSKKPVVLYSALIGILSYKHLQNLFRFVQCSMSGICLSIRLKNIGLKIIKKKQKKENKLEDYSMYDYSEERGKL